MGISQFTSRAAALGVENSKLDTFTIDCMFATLTNVNFDDARFVSLLQKADQLIVDAKAMYEKACRDKGVKPEILSGPATWRLPKNNASADDLVKQAKEKGDLIDRQQRHGEVRKTFCLWFSRESFSSLFVGCGWPSVHAFVWSSRCDGLRRSCQNAGENKFRGVCVPQRFHAILGRQRDQKFGLSGAVGAGADEGW